MDIALLQEPPVAEDGCTVFDINIGGVRTVMTASKDGRTPGAAILIINPELRVITLGKKNPNLASVIIQDKWNRQLMLVSIYFKYSMPTITFVEMIRQVSDRAQVVIVADTNAHSRLWHCPNNNSRGFLLNDLIEDTDLKVLNNK